MRVLHLVAGSKWTGPAAVAIDQVRALRTAGIEAEVGFISESPLAGRLAAEGWARPLLSRRSGPPAFFRDVAKVADLLDREGFDLLHCHTSHDHLVGLGAAPGRRLPIVRSFHHARTIRTGPWSRWAVRRSAAYAFANGAIAREFADRFGNPGPMRVLSPVVDREVFHPGPASPGILASFGVPPGAFVVGTIGKMAKGRGHEEAVRILSRSEDREVVLFHIGKGERREAIWMLAEALGVGDRNFGAGYQEEILPSLYRSMHALLFTASGSDQGHRAVLEAIASGVPVVALAIPGIEDARLAQGAGLVCRSEGEAAEAIAFVKGHPAQREAMSRFARDASERFSPASFAASAAGFYAEALETWKNRGRRNVTLPLMEKP